MNTKKITLTLEKHKPHYLFQAYKLLELFGIFFDTQPFDRQLEEKRDQPEHEGY